MNSNTESSIYTVLVVLIVLIIAFLLLLRLVMINDTFRHELKYIKMEIRRSAGKERRYWLHEKKKLWLSLIPFYRR